VLADNLIGIIAQRLVRRLCPHCRRPCPDKDLERRLRGSGEQQQDGDLYKAVGCNTCNHQGYKGRTAIMELLRVNEDLADLIACGASSKALRAAALNSGFRTLADDGAALVLNGTTSLEELVRVVDMTQRLNSG
jgi:general secretion pathway protein E/type IV pilus assembly protein PilB